MTKDATATLINSLVTSRLDNLNSLLIGLPDNLLSKLQRIQYHAAKIVTKKNKSDHVTPLLFSLHWIPISFRIKYKIILITYKCLNGLAPEYQSCKLLPYKPTRTLRSQDNMLLVEKAANLSNYGDRSFSVVAPKLWNSLPLELRKSETIPSFKSNLKTYLFKQAFNV